MANNSSCVLLSLSSSSFSSSPSIKLCTKLAVTLDELDSVTIDTGTLSSKYVMMDVRSSAQVLNDLPRNSPASPKVVSGMIDFRARIFASSSTLLACLIPNSATSCSQTSIVVLEASSVFGLVGSPGVSPSSMRQICQHPFLDQND